MSASFLLQYLRHPRRTGAIAPSSRSLARALVGGMDLERARLVVEYGPGTGAVTREIVERLAPGARFIAVEASPVFCARLQQTFPELLVERATVSSIPRLLAERGLGPVDAIVSGIPWTLMKNEERERDIEATVRVLRRGGRFSTFLYKHGLVLPAAADLVERLGSSFSTVERERTVWNNFPPAEVLRCVR